MGNLGQGLPEDTCCSAVGESTQKVVDCPLLEVLSRGWVDRYQRDAIVVDFLHQQRVGQDDL